MKKKKLLLIIIVSIIVICGLLSVWDSIRVDSSIGSHPIDHIESLLINENDLPAGWKFEYIQQPIHPGPEDWGIENTMEYFSLKPERGSALQYVYRFKNIYASMYAYNPIRQYMPITKGNTYQFLTYKSAIANDWYLACEYSTIDFVGTTCDVVARYEDYIVYFSIAADKDGISSEGLRKVLETIDNRMASIIKK
jgi:hypothetical protein